MSQIKTWRETVLEKIPKRTVRMTDAEEEARDEETLMLRAEVERLTKETERQQTNFLQLRLALGLGLHSNDNLLDVAQSKTAALTAAEADAARYRWLRNDAGCAIVGVYKNARTRDAIWLESAELDAAIDAAMKGTP